MLLDSAQEQAVRCDRELSGVGSQSRELGGHVVARVDGGVDLVVGVSERHVVDRHARPPVGNSVQVFEAGRHRTGGHDGPVELGHLPRRARVVVAC